ncbi:hypothetical protein Tco_1134660 [Tanacetum coccineum]
MEQAVLSMELGACLAGLLLAETEFSLQVESLLVSNFPVIMGSLGLLTLGKTILVAGIGRLFGVSLIPAILAPGGDFTFVAFGEPVN